MSSHSRLGKNVGKVIGRRSGREGAHVTRGRLWEKLFSTQKNKAQTSMPGTVGNGVISRSKKRVRLQRGEGKREGKWGFRMQNVKKEATQARRGE